MPRVGGRAARRHRSTAHGADLPARRSGWPPASTRTPSASTRWRRSASGTSRSARSPASPSPATRSRGCSGCPRTGRSSTGWASTTTAPRSSPAGCAAAHVDARHRATRRAIGADCVRCSGSTSARPRWCPRTTRRRCWPTTRRAPRLLAPYADYLVVNVSSPNTPGLRDLQAVEKLGPAARRRYADAPTTVTRPPGAAAGQDRPRPRRRRRARRRRPRHRASGWTGIIATNTTITRDGLRHATRPRSSGSAPAGCPGAPLAARARWRCCGCSRDRVGDDLTLVSVGGITTRRGRPRPARRPGATCSRPTPRSSTRARCWPRRSSVAAGGLTGMSTERGPVHVTGEVLATRKVGAFRHLTLVAPGHPRAVPARHLRRALGRRTARRLRAGRGRSGSTGSSPTGGHGADHRDRGRGRSAPAPAGWPRCRPGRGSRSPGRSAARSPCPRSRSAACSSATGTPRRRCSPSPSGCASAAAASPGGRRRRRGPPAVRPGGPPVGPRGHRGHRRRLGRAAGPGRRPPGRAARAAPGPTSSTPPARRRCCTPSRRPPRRRRLEPDRPGASRWPARTGLCQGCAVPVVGEDGAPAHGPGLRRRPGVPRRPGPLGATCRSRRDDRRPLAGLTLPRPVLVASGCGGTGRELAAYGDLAALGGFVTRSITLDRPPGRRRCRGSSRPPAAWSTPSGCQNPGLDHFLATELPWLVRRAPASSSRSPAAWGSTPSWPGGWAAPGRGRRRGQPLRARRHRHRRLRRPRALPRRQRRRRGPARPPARHARCSRRCAPTSAGSSRPRGPCWRRAPTPSSIGNACPAACPTGAPEGSAAPRSGPWRCAASPRCTRALPDGPVVGCGRHRHDRRRPRLPRRRGGRGPGRHRAPARPHHRPRLVAELEGLTPGEPMTCRSEPACTPRCASAGSCAPGSTRTPRCCTRGG